MTEIGDRITRVRQEGFIHEVSRAKGWNPYHASNEWAETDAWLKGARDGKEFLYYYMNLPSELASWNARATLELTVRESA